MDKLVKVKSMCVSAVAVAAIGLSGCSVVDTASSAYNGVKSAYSAKSAYSDVKDLKNASPVFSGMSAVAVGSTLAPRKGDGDGRLAGAFQESMVGIVERSAAELGVQLQVCASVQSCGGRVLSVQFVEEAYDSGLLEKVTMGSKLKGKLDYTDAATGQVLASKRIEGVTSYAEVLAMIRSSITTSMMRSYNRSLTNDQFARIPAVAPGDAKILEAS